MYLHILQCIITFKSFKCKEAINTTTIYGIYDNIPKDFSIKEFVMFLVYIQFTPVDKFYCNTGMQLIRIQLIHVFGVLKKRVIYSTTSLSYN